MPDLLQRSTRDKDPSTNHFFLFLSSFNRRLSTAYSFFGVIVQQVKLIECPRDAWQGLADFIPTETKAEYLNELVVAGFKHIDAVSFVSPKHVKQMADSEEVMAKLNASLPVGDEPPEIIGIVVNEKGLERALATPGVTTIGYPYSISAYFRRANANMTRAESRSLVEKLRKETT